MVFHSSLPWSDAVNSNNLSHTVRVCCAKQSCAKKEKEFLKANLLESSISLIHFNAYVTLIVANVSGYLHLFLVTCCVLDIFRFTSAGQNNTSE